MKQDNKEKAVIDVQPYIDALMHTFNPAATPEEATHFFTTGEGQSRQVHMIYFL